MSVFGAFLVRIQSVCEKNGPEKLRTRTLLFATIDSVLSFNIYITSLCFKKIQKLDALPRITNYMNFYKKQTLLKNFFTSKSNYFPLNRMSNSRGLSTRINHLLKHLLRNPRRLKRMLHLKIHSGKRLNVFY